MLRITMERIEHHQRSWRKQGMGLRPRWIGQRQKHRQGRMLAWATATLALILAGSSVSATEHTDPPMPNAADLWVGLALGLVLGGTAGVVLRRRPQSPRFDADAPSPSAEAAAVPELSPRPSVSLLLEEAPRSDEAFMADASEPSVQALAALLPQPQVADALAKPEIDLSGDQLQQMVANLAQVVWVVQLRPLRNLYVNPAYEAVFGASCASLYADAGSWLNYVVPSDRDRLLPELAHHQATGQTLNLEFQIINGRGEYRWIRAQMVMLHNTLGEPDRSMGCAEDVTEAQQAKIALERSEARLQSVATNIPGGLYRFEYYRDTEAAQFTYLSPSCRNLYELEPKAILANMQLAWDRVHADDLPALRASIQQSAQTLQPWYWRGRFVMPSGQTKWVQGMSNPDPRPDGRIVWDGLMLDVTERQQAEEGLRAERDLLNSVMNTSVAAITILDPNGQIIFANQQAEDLLGMSLQGLTRRTFNDAAWRITDVDGGAWPEERLPFIQILKTGQPVHDVRHAIEWPDGRRRILSVNGEAVKQADGAITNLVFTVNDITEQLAAEQALRDSEAHLRLVAENMSDLVCLHTPDGLFTYISPSCWEILGYTIDELIARSPYDFVHPDDVILVRHVLHNPALMGKTGPSLFRFQHKSGAYIWLETIAQPTRNEVGEVIGIQSTSRNVSERVEHQLQLEYEAHHDALTGLPNRTQLLQWLDAELALGQVSPCAVLFLDLDRFKVVNDSLGHHIGDELLVTVAHQLQALVDDRAQVARLSGDEFVLLLRAASEADAIHQAQHMAGRILDSLRQPCRLGDREIFISTSIGIALSHPRHQSGTDLLRDADLAMYRAKAEGKGRYVLFDPTMHLQVLREMQLESSLRCALENHEFEVFYQPIVNLHSGHISGFEALLRWHHSELGLVSPAEFIPIAEETGLIIPLGRWALRTACHQLRKWQQRFPVSRAMTMNVNLSAVQLRDGHLTDFIDHLLTFSGLSSDCLILEMTESLLVDHVDYNLEVLEQIRRYGIKLSIDDFGTGYSALSYLQQFPFSGLKVDRSFVSHLGTEAENPTLIKAILALASSLSLQPVAEGIETPQQLEFLRANGCSHGQGFLLYKPMPAAAIETLLIQGHTASVSALWQDNSGV